MAERRKYWPDLCKISGSNDLNGRVEILAKHIKTVLKNLEKEVDVFEIGKTLARSRTRREFDPDEFNTWDRSNVIQRWAGYENREFDGLVVVCAVTKDMLPTRRNSGTDGPLFEHQSYTIALRQQLIHHFAYTEQDPRLGEASFNSGKRDEGSNAKAYVIFVAYKFEQNEE